MSESSGAEVSILIQMLDGNPERIRKQITDLASSDKTFERHWLEVLEVAADYRERDISAAYRIWRRMRPKQRPAPMESGLSLAALDHYPKPEGHVPVGDFKDSRDARFWRQLRERNVPRSAAERDSR